MAKTKNAFTLGEIMVTLAVVGVLAAIMLPTVGKAKPNKPKALFKKAYYVAERMVYELVNDEDIYPSNGLNFGLDSVGEIEYLGQPYGSDSDENLQKSKFCKIFSRKVNTVSDVANCTADNADFTGSPSFKTTDGIAWYMPFSDFSDTPQIIRVDISGEDSPNCTYSDSCPNPDRFEIKVETDGKMYVDGTKEKEYLSSNNSIK